MGSRRAGRGGSRGQTVVEYLLTTVLLVAFFAGLYAFMQREVKVLFTSGATMILKSYR